MFGRTSILNRDAAEQASGAREAGRIAAGYKNFAYIEQDQTLDRCGEIKTYKDNVGGVKQFSSTLEHAQQPQKSFMPLSHFVSNLEGCVGFHADVELAVFARAAKTHAALLLLKSCSIVSAAAGFE